MNFFLERDEDTICATATPPGIGGISVIRVSGAKCITVVRKLAPFLPEAPKSHQVYYGYISELKGSRESIDEVLISFFKEGRSFTGEDTVEISCHGSPQICSQILQELIQAGARLANKGEFTYRAFSNGRIDLVQAESVLSLIESETKKSSRLALRQLKGSLSSELSKLEDQLTLILAHLEANIDFSAEDIVVASTQDLESRLLSCIASAKTLLQSYYTGKVLQNGLKVGLIGPPNVGKSTILNYFAGEEKAIVTDVPGTTRDLIEAKVVIDGQAVCFVDTAGLRETTDKVEALGIKKVKSILKELDEIFIILDLSSDLTHQLQLNNVDLMLDKPVIIIGNKVDSQRSEYSDYALKELLLSVGKAVCKPVENAVHEDYKLLKIIENLSPDSFFKVSATSGQNLVELHSHITNKVHREFSESSALISQSRHFELLKRCESFCEKTLILLREEASDEFVVFELQEALKAVHEILGKQFDEQVMDRVFKEFCLGK